MKKKKEEEQVKNKKVYKGLNLFAGVIVGMFVCITVYLIYNLSKLSGIEDLIRYIVMIALGLVSIFVVFRYFRFKKNAKIGKYIMFILVLAIIGTGEFFVSSTISKSVSFIDKLNKDEVTYKSSLIALKAGDYNTLNKAKEGKIGIISDENDTEGYVLAQKIIKKDKIKKSNLVKYDDYMSMLNDLYDGEVGSIFVSGSYVDKYSSIDKYAKIDEEVKELDSYSKRMKKQVDKTTEVSTKKVTEPFTMLLLGVDSPTEDISKASGLGDSIMLVTFNPKTLTATMFSIPRDTFVPITCYRNARSKITHAAAGGDSCMISTVENFTEIDIDYYAKVNFQGLIKLVNALGGIDVEVPYSFCESNSVRSLESADLIFVEKGMQHLNGEQALALSRNRKEVPECGKQWNKGTRNDFVRGQNQQLVIKGIINKMKNIKSINQLYEVLDAISVSLDTNLTREQILGFYNVFKKVLLNSDSLSDSNDIIKIQKTYLNGSGGLMFDNVAGMNLYEFVPSTQSLNAIIKAMKVNLELVKEEYDTSFSFSIDNKYEQKVIGADLYGGVASYPSKSDTTSSDSKCGTNEELGADGKTCVCKNGYTKNSSGVCEKKDSKCGTNEELGADGTSCVCKNGYTRNKTTAICEKSTEKTCTEENEELGADGKTCVCKNGYTKNSSGVCEKKPTVSCGANSTLGADGVTCVCDSGYKKDSSGSCVKEETTTPPTPEEDNVNE